MTAPRLTRRELRAAAHAELARDNDTQPLPLPVRTRCLADILPEPVEWVWRRRLVADSLNLIEGAPAAGKTTLACELIARTTTGAAWPDEPRNATRPPRDVLIVGPEDTASRVLVPRLIAAGADLLRVHLVEREPTPDNPAGALALPGDLPLIAAKVEAHQPALLYFDALHDLLVGVRIDNDAEVRAALRPLVALAEKHAVCALATRHFGKGGNRHAMYAGLGSVGFSAVARVVLHLYAERGGGEDGGGNASRAQRLLAVAKCNLAPSAPTLRFTLESTGDGADDDAPPRVRWEGTDARTAEDLQAEYRADDDGDADKRAERTEAEAWLVAALAGGKRGAADLKAAALADGIAWRTVQRARGRVGVRVERLGFGGGSVWHPPAGGVEAADNAAPGAHSRHSRHSRPRATSEADDANSAALDDADAPVPTPVGRSRPVGAAGTDGVNGANGANEGHESTDHLKPFAPAGTALPPTRVLPLPDRRAVARAIVARFRLAGDGAA